MPPSDLRRAFGLPPSAPRGARAAMKAALAAELGLARAPNVRDSLLRRLVVDVAGAGFADLAPDAQLARAAAAAAVVRRSLGAERAVVVVFEDTHGLGGCTVTRRVEYVFQAAAGP